MAQLIESITKPLQSTGNKKLSGIFAIADEFNQNKRKYPERVYEEAYQELIPKIQSRSLLGELDHPLERDEVFLSNVSHVITECHTGTNERGHKVYYGTVELLDTPAGKIAQALDKAGIPLGISSRGVGNTRQIADGVEVTQLKLITYDLVAEPSFQSAVLSAEKQSELAESLNHIESKIPLNESKENDSIRNYINTIRESLRLTESGVNHISEQEVQTLELKALRSLLESKSKVIASDTERLKEQRQRQKTDARRISELEESLKDANSRYTSIRENHQKLQSAYNNLEKSYEVKMSKALDEKDAEIADLRKRLAVEQRGMSYSQVKGLLEGLMTEEEINSRLDYIPVMGRRSSKLTESYAETIKEQLTTTNTQRSPLSKVISRV